MTDPVQARRTWKTWQLVAFSLASLLLGIGMGVAAAPDSTVNVAAEQATTTSAPEFVSSASTLPLVTAPHTSAAPTTSTTRPAPTTTTPKRGERSNPVPRGSSATFTNGWKVTVVGTTADGTAAVRAENRFNDPPPAGSQFYLVNISAEYAGSGSQSPLGDLRFSALDSSNTQIDEGRCGVVPNEFDSFTEVFTGGALSGNICFVVSSATAGSMIMYVDAGLLQRERAFFALT